MIVKTQEDWFELAETTILELPDYLEKFMPIKRSFLKTELNEALNKKDWKTLSKMFEEFWDALPDNSSIRIHPFHDLCDLCSEVWVFYEEESDNLE